MSSLRAGIIGPSGIGRVHLDALRRIGVEVVAIAASTASRGRELSLELGVKTGCANAEQLVGLEDVDVVHVCTPNAFHAEQVRLALAAGKHVVCEKPLATSADEAHALHVAGESGGTVHAVAYNYRFFPMVKAMREAVSRGRLGPVHLIRGCYLLDEVLLIDDPDSWLLDPGRRGQAFSLADVGVHWWDLVEYVSGQSIERVLCTRQVVRSPDAVGEDSAAVMMRLSAGATALAAISGAAPGHSNTIQLELIGTEASTWWEQEEPDRLWHAPLGGAAELSMRAREPIGSSLPKTVQMPAGHIQGYLDAFRDLIATIYRGIDNGETGAYPTFADGARGVSVLEALTRSADSGQWTTVQMIDDSMP